MQRVSYLLLVTALLLESLFPSDLSAVEIMVKENGGIAAVPAPGDLDRFEGMIVDSIEVHNREIFDTDKKPYNNVIFRTANKLHVVTRKAVIARELLIQKGDRFNVELAEEMARNLRSRYSIYDAWIEIEPLPEDRLLMRLMTIDEWSLSVGVNIRREGNEYRYNFGLEESNFLGFNQFISFDYFVQEKDENYVELSFKDVRFLSHPVSVSLAYSDNPDSDTKSISVGHPFYTLSQKFSFSFSTASSNIRNEIFRDKRMIGKSQTHADMFSSNLSYRFGYRLKNIVTGISYRYDFESTGGKEFFGSTAADSNLAAASFPEDSLYHQIGLGVRGFLVDFTTYDKVDGFGFTEDFTLGHTAAINYRRAFSPEFGNYVYDEIAFQYSVGINFGNELFYLSYSRVNKFKSDRDYQRFYYWSGNYYHRGPDYFTLAFNSTYIRDWRFGQTESLVLGGESGIRGYSTEFRTGDRMAVFNLEGRLHPNLRLFSTVLGFVGFVDGGRTWKPVEPVSFKDFYFSGGVGLRFALDRTSRSRFLRLDLAYSETNKWEISLGTGQYFSYRKHSLFLTTR